MIKCKCGREFPAHVPSPIYCSCGGSIVHTPAEVPTKAKGVTGARPNAWTIAHSHIADCIQSGQWNEAAEREWYRTEFLPLVPKSCCSDSWGPIAAKLDWSTAEAAFRSFWLAHNEVSTKHAGKPAIAYEQCRALYLPQPSMDDCCVAVTSLAPNRLERQTVCLDSWKRAGLTIHAVQSANEELKEEYPQVSSWSISGDSGPPRINALAKVATQTGSVALLINADVEIHGEQRLIREAIASGTLIGVRHNYDSQWWQSKPEQWGMDAFSFTPEAALRLPNLDLRIGRPVWDYWILDYFKSSQMNWICEPLFFHKTHELGWSAEDFKAGFEKLQQAGSAIDQPYGAVFRKSFPYPPVNK